jgi:hypothetical protein
MNEPDLTSYVRAALILEGYRFDERQIQQIVAQFARIEAVARDILAAPLDERAGAAAVFRP